MKKTEINKIGRPTKYFSDYDKLAYEQCLLGSTDKELADFFRVSRSTLSMWKKKHPSFSDSIKQGKDLADGKVANSMFNRAIGMTIPSVHVSNRRGNVTLTPVQKYLPPDPRAGIFWLKNRKSENWKDTPNPTNKTQFSILNITIHEYLE